MNVTSPIAPDSDAVNGRLWDLLHDVSVIADVPSVHPWCPPPPMPLPSPTHLGDQLAVLAGLYLDGLLTGTEFCTAKSIILGLKL